MRSATLIALDYDETFLRALRATLAAAGHTVATTHSGVEAARLLETGAFACAFLSTTLPGRGGLQVLDDLHQMPAGAGVAVALVAGSEPERIGLLGHPEVGADVVLTKPLGAQDVLETLVLLRGEAPATEVFPGPDQPAAHGACRGVAP